MRIRILNGFVNNNVDIVDVSFMFTGGFVFELQKWKGRTAH